MPLQDQDWVIHDGNWEQFVGNIDKTQGRGLIPRNFETHPTGCFAFAPEFPDEMLIPQDKQESFLQEQKSAKASLLNRREENYDILKSLYQNGYGLCWAFSSTKANMYVRAFNNQPLLRFSAYWVAGRVKGWRDQGGWNLESLQKIIDEGVPEEHFCPEYRSSYDTAECRANAALHKITEWWDGSSNREKAKQQMITCLLLGMPCMVDLNWMGHSMCAMHLESLNPLVVFCDNSWGENSGNKGLYRLEGSRAIPDAVNFPRVTRFSTK